MTDSCQPLKDDPKYASVIQETEKRLRSAAQLILTSTLTELLSQGDILLLSLMGIDGQQKLLDLFIEECQHLKKEIDNGTRTQP